MSKPSNLIPYLIENESVLKEWASKRWDNIYATQYRVFFVKSGILDKKFIEVAYSHISSIEFGRVRKLSRLIGAIICFISAFILYRFSSFIPWFLYRGFLSQLELYLIGILIISGIILLILFILGRKGFVLHINGRNPIIVSKELTQLVKFVRQHAREMA